jgi:hypothetical protein
VYLRIALREFLYSRECAFAQRSNPPRRMRAPRRNNFAIASKRADAGRRSGAIGPDDSGALANNPASPGTFSCRYSIEVLRDGAAK